MRDEQLQNSVPQWLLDACQCSEGTPLRKAIFEVFSNAINSEMITATQANLTDGERQFRAGRLAAIMELKDDWKALFKEANKPKEEGD